MAIRHNHGALDRCADNLAAMYDERVSEESLGANPACSTDVTNTPPSSPTPPPTASPQHPFDDINDDSDHDQLHDV